jgi:hypothetical protein
MHESDLLVDRGREGDQLVKKLRKSSVMEQVYRAKGSGMYPLTFLVITLLLVNAYCCASAAILVKSNTTFRCDGRLHECLVEDDLEFDFLINPYVTRILAGTSGSGSGGTGNANKPAIDCAKNPPQTSSCISDLKNNGKTDCVPRSTYDKTCT